MQIIRYPLSIESSPPTPPGLVPDAQRSFTFYIPGPIPSFPWTWIYNGDVTLSSLLLLQVRMRRDFVSWLDLRKSLAWLLGF